MKTQTSQRLLRECVLLHQTPSPRYLRVCLNRHLLDQIEIQMTADLDLQVSHNRPLDERLSVKIGDHPFRVHHRLNLG